MDRLSPLEAIDSPPPAPPTRLLLDADVSITGIAESWPTPDVF